MVSVCIIASSERGQMIARVWRGWASQATAGDYQRHYETEVSRHLQEVKGFCGARLLRCDDGQEVMFTSVAFFISIDAVRSFAGDDYEQAIVEEAARRALNRWDERVSHHDVAVDLPGTS
jgi:heme-degrading monooxygenase HmoA